ncbi:MAG TPA: GlsB/YeaQ/YmgE family stress response membrane protein [Gemmatimonadota bacterium]|nr:GlsB/YeaQ/YmgE family stress response membrane protein [Gemmatimonadota bacterium]
MTLVDLLLLLLVAGIIGSIGQAIAGFERGGCLVSIGVGFIGALLGAWLGRQLGAGDLFVLEVGGTSFPVVWSIIGATVFVAIISLIARGRP